MVSSPNHDEKGSNVLLKRVISALIAIPALLIPVYFGGLTYTIAVAILVFLGIREFNGMLDQFSIKPIRPLSYIGSLAIISAGYLGNLSLITAIIVLLFLLLFIFLILGYSKYKLVDIVYSFIGILYNAVLFNYLIMIRLHLKDGLGLTILLFACVWINDSAAFFAGSYFGKKKLCPHISPKKTVEGSIGGLLGALIPAIIGGTILKLGVAHSIIIGLIAGGLGQLGDLAESAIKRYFKIKDSGKFMPGHGGVLDRFDSILFAAPVLYYYLLLFLTKG